MDEIDPKTQMPSAVKQMPNRAIIVAAVLFVLIVIGMFVYAYLMKTEQAPESVVTEEDQTTEEPDAGRFGYLDRITGTHYYLPAPERTDGQAGIDGVHTVVGEIPMPTPCDLLEAEAIVAESYPEQITLDFTVINNADMCTQVITPARFRVEATASPEASFSARFEGRTIDLNLTPAPEGETPDEFELFLKG